MKTYSNLFLSLYAIICCSSIAMAQSPYIDRVYDYSPAPGQFINTMPKYEQGDTKSVMAQKAEDAIAANKRSMVCLGGLGGSITFGFDHDIINLQGQYDFQILGNAILTATTDGRQGGSSEPGIIYVAQDENSNGLPDDKWYEIAGSEYNNPLTKHNYTITYYRPSANHQPTPSPSDKSLTDTSYIAWRTSDGTIGYIPKNSFHSQDYYPQWISQDSVSFTTTCLAPNAEWKASNGMYVLYCYDYGYADNYPNNTEQSKINIDWAVDSIGQSVQLPSIRFVKICTGVNQQCGWIGETSTEVMGAIDLHLTEAVEINEYANNDDIIGVYSINGILIANSVAELTEKGIYIVRYSNNQSRKIVIL